MVFSYELLLWKPTCIGIGFTYYFVCLCDNIYDEVEAQGRDYFWVKKLSQSMCKSSIEVRPTKVEA